VEYWDQPEIGVPYVSTPFTIGGTGGLGADAEPADNVDLVTIGVPDLVVQQFYMEPALLVPNVPVTFTVQLANQGSGTARNPDVAGGRFWLDIFVAPVSSYPWERYSEKDIYGIVPVLAPGATTWITLTHEGFSAQEISEEIQGFYAKVDNHQLNPHGLVPESNEMNNVGTLTEPIRPACYLPLVIKQ
jgi:hypothetical protein